MGQSRAAELEPMAASETCAAVAAPPATAADAPAGPKVPPGSTDGTGEKPRAKINIALSKKKKPKKSTAALALGGDRSSRFAEEYSTVAEEAEAISRRRREEGDVLVIPCKQGKDEEEKRKHPLMAGRLAMLNSKESTQTESAADNGASAEAEKKPTDAAEDEAIKQLIESAENKEGSGNNGSSGGKSNGKDGLVIAAPSQNNLTTKSRSEQAADPVNEDEQFKRELSHYADDVDPTSNVYASVAIGDFGSALLRGMGWKGGSGGGSNDEEQAAAPIRPGGATPRRSHNEVVGTFQGGGDTPPGPQA